MPAERPIVTITARQEPGGELKFTGPAGVISFGDGMQGVGVKDPEHGLCVVAPYPIEEATELLFPCMTAGPDKAWQFAPVEGVTVVSVLLKE